MTTTTTTTEQKPARVKIPADIIAANHRRAFAMAYRAAAEGRRLAFVSPIVRHSICRGFFAGARDRFTGPRFHSMTDGDRMQYAYETAPANVTIDDIINEYTTPANA